MLAPSTLWAWRNYQRLLREGSITTDYNGKLAVGEVLIGQLTPEEGVLKLKAEADAAIRNASM